VALQAAGVQNLDFGACGAVGRGWAATVVVFEIIKSQGSTWNYQPVRNQIKS